MNASNVLTLLHTKVNKFSIMKKMMQKKKRHALHLALVQIMRHLVLILLLFCWFAQWAVFSQEDG